MKRNETLVFLLNFDHVILQPRLKIVRPKLENIIIYTCSTYLKIVFVTVFRNQRLIIKKISTDNTFSHKK